MKYIKVDDPINSAGAETFPRGGQDSTWCVEPMINPKSFITTYLKRRVLIIKTVTEKRVEII